MLPGHMPVLSHGPVRLRRFRDSDVDVVLSVATDPLIPLITTVPVSGRRMDALAFIRRQHERLPSGVGYSFAIAEAVGDGAVGQIGLWLRDYQHGQASVGYWISPRQRGHGYASAALQALVGGPGRSPASRGSSFTSSRRTNSPGERRSAPASSAKDCYAAGSP
jgi:RimJ/RimL family protein N-acetyltransferase